MTPLPWQNLHFHLLRTWVVDAVHVWLPVLEKIIHQMWLKNEHLESWESVTLEVTNMKHCKHMRGKKWLVWRTVLMLLLQLTPTVWVIGKGTPSQKKAASLWGDIKHMKLFREASHLSADSLQNTREEESGGMKRGSEWGGKCEARGERVRYWTRDRRAQPCTRTNGKWFVKGVLLWSLIYLFSS